MKGVRQWGKREHLHVALWRDGNGKPLLYIKLKVWKATIGDPSTPVSVKFDPSTGFLYVVADDRGRVYELKRSSKIVIPIKLVDGMDKRVGRLVRVVPTGTPRELVLDFGLG